MIRIINIAPPKEPERKERKSSEPRVTLADTLNELPVGDKAAFLEGKKKTSVSSQLFTLRKSGKVVGDFKLVQGPNDEYPDHHGVLVWRKTDGKPALSVAAE